MQQSDAVSDRCGGLEEEIDGLEADINRITALKHQYEQNYGVCKVSMCTELFSV
jgi:hypothetical protein